MSNSAVLQIIIIVLLVIIIYYYYSQNTRSNAIYQTSPSSNKEYLVQNLEGKEQAAEMLNEINRRIHVLNDYLMKNIDKYPEYRQYILQLNSKINNILLTENAPTGKYTSYTLNKGEEIALCLRSKSTGKLHDINLIMYVVLHELAHVACPEIDHTALFKKIFVFFLGIAVELGIYQKINYQINPAQYCGLTINENLLK